MKVIVVTGGIGSGKSQVCDILEKKGIARYDADARVKSLYAEHPELLLNIENALGCCLRNEKGDFVPSGLAAKIFSDREALGIVENLVFPALLEDFDGFCERNKDLSYVVFESATILEKPQFDGFGDFVLLVDAPFDVRLERACLRDGKSRDEILNRMRNQKLMNELSDGGMDPRIDMVIVNDGSLDELEYKINNLHNNILRTE